MKTAAIQSPKHSMTTKSKMMENNKKLKDLHTVSSDIGDLSSQSNTNDDYILEMNAKIVKYLKSKHHLETKVKKLNQKISDHEETNAIQQEEIDTLKEDQVKNELSIENIENLYKEQLELLSTLGIDEIYRISRNRENIEDIDEFKKIINKSMTLFLEKYSMYLDMNINTFITKYKTEFTTILAVSIYDYEIYNSYDETPDLILYTAHIKSDLKKQKILDFVMKVYFPRLFEYIDEHESDLFDKIEGSKFSSMFNSSRISDFTSFVLLNVDDVKYDDFHDKMKEVLFVMIPLMYTKAYHLSKQRHPYMYDVNNLIMNSLNNCEEAQLFYDLWLSFNPSSSNIKSKVLSKLLMNNTIFSGIYLDKIKAYNKIVSDNKCKTFNRYNLDFISETV